MANKLLLFTIILLLLSLGVRGQKGSGSHGITKAVAMDRVMRLPEVKESNAYIRQHTKDKRKLFPIIYGEPTRERPFWWVAVGEDNGMSFVTYFGFFVYVKSGEILYYDTLKDTAIDLRSWRKSRIKK